MATTIRPDSLAIALANAVDVPPEYFAPPEPATISKAAQATIIETLSAMLAAKGNIYKADSPRSKRVSEARGRMQRRIADATGPATKETLAGKFKRHRNGDRKTIT